MTTLIEFLPTPDGPFGVLAGEDGIVLASGWTDSADALLGRLRPERRPAALLGGAAPGIRDAVDAYYAGEHAAIDVVPVAQEGGPFRSQAWEALPEPNDEADWWIRKSGVEHYAEHIDRLRDWVTELQASRSAEGGR